MIDEPDGSPERSVARRLVDQDLDGMPANIELPATF
jgi:hypothetical protein